MLETFAVDLVLDDKVEVDEVLPDDEEEKACSHGVVVHGNSGVVGAVTGYVEQSCQSYDYVVSPQLCTCETFYLAPVLDNSELFFVVFSCPCCGGNGSFFSDPTIVNCHDEHSRQAGYIHPSKSTTDLFGVGPILGSYDKGNFLLWFDFGLDNELLDSFNIQNLASL